MVTLYARSTRLDQQTGTAFGIVGDLQRLGIFYMGMIIGAIRWLGVRLDLSTTLREENRVPIYFHPIVSLSRDRK